ncbi:recombinase family protein [Belnapia rosea]|uniref:recombinase family protein n=1 Tax=Belnapia rosea TaxID=938405 RepID=UPI0008857CB9|nr:recombinase family protein [Belnapia rosea]SDB74423.1 Site-specific DNA recombinase [Belnapia rosea]
MTTYGYSRVSTYEQNVNRQIDALKEAKCDEIFIEYVSGGSKKRYVLEEVLGKLKPGDKFLVLSIDRLARSLQNLISIVDRVKNSGAVFCSITERLDGSSDYGLFTMHLLGAAAELERKLISDRTKSSLSSAARRGRFAGNPGLVARNPVAVEKTITGKRVAFQTRLEKESQSWLSDVQNWRAKGFTWKQIVDSLNKNRTMGFITERKLVHNAKKLVDLGKLDESVLRKSPLKSKSDKLLHKVVDIKRTLPKNARLSDIAHVLQKKKIKTPHGHKVWKPGSVAHVLARARKLGLS